MRKTLQNIFIVVSVLAAFAVSFCAQLTDNNNHISFSNIAEASWIEDFGHDVWDDYKREGRRTGDEIRRENRRSIRKLRKEQRNISRADGDRRFADRYISDDELVALRTLKSLPVGSKLFIECSQDRSYDIRRMCRKLTEFTFYEFKEDENDEPIGCIVKRTHVVY